MNPIDIKLGGELSDPDHKSISQFLPEALTFDDVLLIPDYADFLPGEVNLKSSLTRNITLNIPFVSSAMDTVTEARLAIAIAQEGGIGIIHKNLSIAQQAAEVAKVKKHESGVVKDPVTVSPNTTVLDLLALMKQHPFSGVPVVENNQVVGLVTSRDLRFETNLKQPIKNIMTPQDKLITVKEGTPKKDVIALLHKHRIEKILVVGENFLLKGLITVKDIQKAIDKPYASKDGRGQLQVGAAVSTAQDVEQRVKALSEVGVDVLVVDTAHGHSKGVIDRVRWIKTQYPHIDVIAGNVATSAAAQALVSAGADAIKVGIGPGSICTTRVVTGIGMPQLTAITSVAKVLKPLGVPLIADGGIRFSGDITKALAAGASSVMIGSLFAGTDESPGEVILVEGRSYKIYQGMGSIEAMAKGAKDRYFQEGIGTEKLIPEGVVGRVPYKGAFSNVLHQLVGGLRAGMGYIGCKTISEMHHKAHFVKVSSSGVHENHVHDITLMKEPPNYSRGKS